ncbi:MAG: MarR family winged helix-turn-helix transcriptional regulator [Burkholderiaceae bacterium]|nr:MarR family winged helix-turn-helix transcriptional regulator [Burkholderiaceae bacterium]
MADSMSAQNNLEINSFVMYYIKMNSSKRYTHSEKEQHVERAHQRAVGEPLGDVRLSILIKHNAGLLSDLMNKALEPYGISSVGYIAMMALYGTPDNLANPSDICQASSETRSNMTRIVDELVEKGLIKRVPNQDDRRRVDLSLTPAGDDLLRVVVPIIRKSNEAVFSVFSSETKAIFEADMLRLKNALESRL